MLITPGPDTWLGRFWVATNHLCIVEVQFGVDYPLPPEPNPLGWEAVQQIVEFLEGDRHTFHLPLDWKVLPPAHADMLHTLFTDVQWGQYVTYAELATMSGYPGAARSAGQACKMNPFALIVPAHRVIAAGGRIGGFQGRPDIKRKLLEREGLGPFRD